MAVNRVGDVACGEHARQVRARGAAFGDDIAAIEFDLAAKERGLRIGADGDEDGVRAERGLLARGCVFQREACDLLAVAEDLRDDRVHEEGDFAVCLHAVHHCLRRAELVAAVDDSDGGTEAGEEVGVGHGGVAAAEHRDFLAGEEEAVAGGAIGDAMAGVLLLARGAELAVRGAGGDDDGTALIAGAGVGRQLLDVAGQVDGRHIVVVALGAELLGLLLHGVHEVGALHAVGESGEVFDSGGAHQLAAGVERARDDERFVVGAS